MPNARQVAFQSLQRYGNLNTYSNIEIDSALKKYPLDNAEKNLYVSLVYGVIERLLTLDFLIDCVSTRVHTEMDDNVLIPIRLALYQIIFMDKIPFSAAVDESVKLTKDFFGTESDKSRSSHRADTAAGFTNAVLRSFLRYTAHIKKPTLDEILSVKPFSDKFTKLGTFEKMSIIYSYPAWLCKMFSDSYGEKTAELILAAQNGKGQLTLRVNTLKIPRESLYELLTSRGITAENTDYSPFGINIIGCPISNVSDVLSDGLAFVQDEASQLASIVLGASPADKVIDCCSCPGGKSFSSAILMENKGAIISCDLHKSKLSLVDKGAQRLGIDIIKTRETDCSVFDEALANEFLGGADKVICDVPCSGLGVIAKKPEIRYKSMSDIERLPSVQLKILKSCAKYVKVNGVLVYSTCTLNTAENQENIAAFLESSPNFELCDFKFDSSNCSEINSKHGMITLFPHINKTDGFFIAKMIRTK